MSGRRFKLLTRFLHFVDNSSLACKPNAAGRKLAKIQPLIELLLPRFRNNYVPKKNIVIDESFLGLKGRLLFVQYISTKRKRF